MTFPHPHQPSTIVITGGTGSFGSAFARVLLAETSYRVRILSRDEHKQDALMRELPPGPQLTYILADVRDKPTLVQAFDGAWAVVHAAALKVVGMGQQHADEFMRTNVIGSANVIDAALAAGVRRCLLISTDKAVHPINAYGKGKAVAEELFVHANKRGVTAGCAFSAVRGGNVWGSNGSVATLWRQQQLPLLTDPQVTRFNLTMPSWTAFVMRALVSMWGGEIFVPIAPAWNLLDLAAALGKGINVTGPRQGDKQHETLVSADEMARTITTDWAHIIEPPAELRSVWNYEPWVGTPLAAPYTSDTARRMGIEELRELWAM